MIDENLYSNVAAELSDFVDGDEGQFKLLIVDVKCSLCTVIGVLLFIDSDVAHAGSAEEVCDVEAEEIMGFDGSIDILLPGDVEMATFGDSVCSRNELICVLTNLEGEGSLHRG